MGMGVRISFLLLLGVIVDAGYNTVISDSSIVHEAFDENGMGSICNVCEELAALAICFLDEKKTQTRIMNILHTTCSLMSSVLKQECMRMVDHYGQLFFTEIGTTQPSEFCKKMDFCFKAGLGSYRDLCTLGGDIVKIILANLKHPGLELEIVSLLLRGCSFIERFVKGCKTFILKYGPVILSDLETFLETIDICSSFWICVTNDRENQLAFNIALPMKS